MNNLLCYDVVSSSVENSVGKKVIYLPTGEKKTGISPETPFISNYSHVVS